MTAVPVSAAPLLDERYALGAPIAAGATATVYEACDQLLDRRVAVKRLHPHLRDTDAARTLRAEGALLARLSHRHIVSCLDAGVEGGVPYLVLEHLAGPDLAAFGGATGVARLGDVVAWLPQLCHALTDLHRRGIVHGDLKSQHIILEPSARVVLIDLGLGAAQRQRGTVAGSAAYLAPEVGAGGAPSPAGDLYALGVVAYRLCTGQLPFMDTDDIELARQHAETAAPRLRHQRPDAPAWLDVLVKRLLAKQPGDRPSAMETLAYLSNRR